MIICNSFLVKQVFKSAKINLKKLLTKKKTSDKIRKSLEGDEEKWSLKIEQNIS